jgi:hypothetical protein
LLHRTHVPGRLRITDALIRCILFLGEPCKWKGSLEVLSQWSVITSHWALVISKVTG